MALYDDAKFIFLGSAAAGLETKDASKIYNVKPVEVLTSEIITSNDSDWTESGDTSAVSVSNGVITFNNTGSNSAIFQNTGNLSGKTIVVRFTISDYQEGTVGFSFFAVNSGTSGTNQVQGNGNYSFTLTVGTNHNGNTAVSGGPTFKGVISNISIKEATTPNADFTISRDANLDATRVGPTGLIEKGRENLLLQSNAFTTTWTTSNSPNITSGQPGYDGSLNAWKIELTANFGQIEQTPSSVPTISTLSIFAKAGTAGFVRLRIDADTNAIADFDLSDGSVAHTSGNIIATTADSFGDGWFRVQMTSTTASGGTVRIYPAVAANDLTGTSGFIYVQDSQLEVGIAATDVITTGTSTGLAGLKEDEPRFDYPLAGGAPSLLIEPERANLITVSEYFGGSGWTDSSSGVTVVNNDAVSPEGIKNAAKLVIDNTISSGAEFRVDTSLNPSVTNGKPYAFSVFAKAAEFNQIQLDVSNVKFGANCHVTATLTGDGSITAGSDVTSSSIENYGNGWYRITMVGTVTGSTGATALIFRLQVDGINGTGDGSKGIHVYGAQFEEGSRSTSYIPTHGTAATRSTDNVSALDTSGFSFGTTCTIFFEGSIGQFNPGASSTIPITMFASHSSPNNAERYVLFASSFSSGTYTLTSRHDHNGNTVGVSKSGLTEGARVKVAAVFNGTSQKFFVNGSSGGSGFTPSDGTNTHVAASLFESLDLSAYPANKNQTVGSLILWGSALTDQQCIDLTTL
jgi:hypothetical protein